MVATALLMSFGTTSPPVQHHAGHVLPSSWVTDDHLVGWFKAGCSELVHTVRLVARLGSSDNRGEGDKGIVDSGVWNQVCLYLVEVDIERPCYRCFQVWPRVAQCGPS